MTSDEPTRMGGSAGIDAVLYEGGAVPGPADESLSLVELVNQLLDKGVVITGEATISVAGVDLVYLGLNVLLTSVATAKEQLGRPPGPNAGR